ARRGWSPNVVYVDHLLSTDLKRKLIPVIAGQHKAIGPLRAGGEPPLPCAWIDNDRLVGRIEVGQRRVIPQNAVSLARQQKGNRNVCVRLVQSDWDSADVENAFLMLPETVQRFIGRRKESLLNIPGLRFEH